MSFLQIYVLALPIIVFAVGLGVAWYTGRDDRRRTPAE
jgi:hypothetical protein